jgi:hypothetical protein
MAWIGCQPSQSEEPSPLFAVQTIEPEILDGHGRDVAPIAVEVRDLARTNINTADHSDLTRGIGEAFRGTDGPGSQRVTAVLGYYSETRELVFVNAGHAPVLRYGGAPRTWDWFHEQRQTTINRSEACYQD